MKIYIRISVNLQYVHLFILEPKFNLNKLQKKIKSVLRDILE